MNNKKSTVIIGGGIGGLTMALSLKKFNIDYQIFEKSKAFKEVGAGIGLSSNALTILDKLGAGEEIRQNGHLIKKTVIADKNLNEIKTIPFPEKKEVYCIHRAKLVAVLSNALSKDSCFFNKEVKSVLNEEKIKVEFKDDSHKTFDNLIASDGINSIIRRSIFPNMKKRNANQIIWRGITTFKIDSNLKHTYHELFGDSLRFLFIPINDNKIFWLAVQSKLDDKSQNLEHIKPYLLDCFKSYHTLVNSMISATNEDEIIQNELEDLKPVYKKWHERNLVFIGDSIHAATPNLAQGACQAIEDAYTLGLSLKQHSDSQKAYRKYQSLRLKKVTHIVKLSWKIGKFSLARNYLSEKLFKVIIKYSSQKSYQKRYQKLIDVSYLDKI